jgi:two-component system, OmpR family, alkaline phosphatase synthesis response regulator PhoP
MTAPLTLEKKILIVDNERHIRTLLKQSLYQLSKRGVKLITAENGQDALKMLDVERPDLLFLDLMMPGMNGFDVCRLIKSDPRSRNTYIVILTARSQSVDKAMGNIVGADEYIVKPFDPEMIAKRAMQILQIPELGMQQFIKELPTHTKDAPSTSSIPAI